MTKEKNDSFQIDLNNYKDSEGLSLKKINFGLWLINHRRHFFIALVMSLVLLSVFFYSYSIYHYVDYFFGSGVKEQQTLNELGTDNMPIDEAQRLKNLAKPLIVGQVGIIERGGQSDMWAIVKNPNLNFTATISYCFNLAVEELACGDDLLFPGEEKNVLSLGNKISKTSNVSFVLKGTQWNRIDPHKISDWPSYYNERINFVVSNISFKDGPQSGLSDKKSISVLDFTIKNDSAYNYWEVPLDIILYSGSIPTVLQRYSVSEFMSGEERSIRVVWPNAIGSVSNTKVVPIINILDDNVYIKYY